jgi:aldehyde:ferredoxin oxidoreductase
MTKTTLPRFQPLHGWTNRLLRVDLSSGRIWAEETAPRVPAFLGARGLAAAILWDEYPEPVDPFDARAPLMVMPGALTGTVAPYSGRTSICGFSPQCWPYPWFTRSNIGADWGARLKRAGYDGLVVTGASERPAMILIHDDEVSILPADGLWGMDTLEAQEAVQRAYGQTARTLTIGPAGERLSRIATIQTGSTSVAGQGGFGAVMGAKKLKAITVIGTGQVAVADGDRLRALFKAVGAEARTQRGRRRNLDAINERLEAEGGGRARMSPCTASCPAPCRTVFSDVPGCHFDLKWTGAMSCVSGRFRGGRDTVYDWDVGMRGAFELNMHANRLGLNHWDLLVGLIPWLRACNRQGLLPEVEGKAFDLNSIDFWVHLLDAIAYRRGMGDALAEGGWRGAQQVDLGVELMRRYYTGWGYSGHWDGHAALVNPIVYPFWLVGALHWAMDTRDPASSTHGYVQGVMYWGPFREALYGRSFLGDHAQITWDHMRGIGERVYGRADTLDPLSGYEGKALPGAYHGVRSVMKDCLPTDDQVFPLMWSYNTEDRYCRIPIAEGPDEGTVVDGIDVDAAILRAGTGLDWDTAKFQRAAERVLNLERAIVIRHWGRTRAMDERVLPYFAYDENWTNPELGERQRLDVDRFKGVMDDYYRLRGWDVDTGWPTRERLAHLDLEGVYDDMVAGARDAQERLPELPPERPVADHHRQ